MIHKPNIITKHISDFTEEDTIYITNKDGFNKPLMLCRFISYDESTQRVIGAIINDEANNLNNGSRIDIDRELRSHLTKCALYGKSKEGSNHQHFHWFDGTGYALNPIDAEKEDSNTHHVEEHESYGMIRGARITSNKHRPLFGTSTNHKQTICIRISKATHKRDLSNDWIHSGEELIEVEISENQFAQFITNMNSEGVPCTIRHLNRKRMEEPPFLSKEELFQKEFESKMKNLAAELRKVTQTSTSILTKTTNITKAEREVLLRDMGSIVDRVSGTIPFIRDQFQEQLTDMINAAKIEMEAFAENLIRRKGLEALGATNEDFRNVLNASKDGAGN